MSFFGNRRQSEPAPPPAPKPAPLPTPTPPPVSQPVGFETVLGANTVLEGTLRSNANVRLDGTFTGTLEISGNVLVGETAKINADINAKNISIAGAVRGNVSGKKVQLLRTGRIWGDIHAMALTTEEGAFIDGKITMVSQEPDPPRSPEEQQPEPEVTNPGMGAMEEDMDSILDRSEGKTGTEPIDVTQHDSPKPISPEGQTTDAGEIFPLGADASEGQDNAASGDSEDTDRDETRQST